MTAAYQQHLGELKKHFEASNTNNKMDDKIECLLHEAYRLKRKNNNLHNEQLNRMFEVGWEDLYQSNLLQSLKNHKKVT